MTDAALSPARRAAWLDRLPAFELGGVAPMWYLEIDHDDLDLPRYRAAWQALVDRHAALRTVITDDGRQRVLPTVTVRMDMDMDVARLAEVRRTLLAGGDVHRWPLFAVHAVRLDERRTRVCIAVDQVVTDHAGLSALGADLTDLYLDRSLAPPTGPDAGSGRAPEHWRSRLAELPPAPQLPLQGDPRLIEQPAFRRRRHVLPAAAWHRLRQHAAAAGIDPEAVLAAAFGEALAGWSKEPRFTIRTRLGLAVLDNDPRQTFRHRAASVEPQLAAVDGPDLLDDLRRAVGQPNDAVIPVVYEAHLRPARAGAFHPTAVQQPRCWLRHDATDLDGALELTYDTVDDLFPPGLLDGLTAHHLRLLQRLAERPTAWDEPAAECLPAAQATVRDRVNDTAVTTTGALLHEGFWAQAARTPDAVAVVTTERTLTYRQLRDAAGALAGRLLTAGDLVAIVMEKGWQQPLAALAVLDAGAAYVPIEPDVPAERLHYLLGHSGARTALVQPHLRDTLDWPAGVTPLVVDDTVLDAPEHTAPRRLRQPADLAYIIYTSGSTGLPKGVMVSHASAWNTIADINRRFAVTADDRMLALTPLSFDLSVYDLFGPFAVGGALVIPDPGSGRAPWHWADLLAEHGVTLWNTVPALMEMLTGYLAGRRNRLPDTLRLVLLSGDWIPVSLPSRILGLAAPHIDLIGLGGATEASIWSIFHRITDVPPEWVSIPYGTPLANQHFEILDEALLRRPDHVPGQQYIGGAGVALGYWRDPEKTGRAFITHPHTGRRLYRTGDLGRYRPDGSIEFLGRDDFQIKIHGYRIELGEIEAALLAHEHVRTAVVTAVGQARGEKRLVAYITVAGDPAPDPDVLVKDVRAHLTGKLPAYMVPTHVLVLDTLPLTANGKVDRKALPSPIPARPAAAPLPTDPMEARLLAAWHTVLGDDGLGPDDDWHAHGATRARIVEVHNQLPGTPLNPFFANRTVRTLATALRPSGDAEPDETGG